MFQIQTVPIDARDELEEIGSKAKFWYEPAGQGRRQWLFKESRVEQGEDWSEKIAAELADLLGLPHAVYELATWNGRRGVVTPRIERREERLTLGDEFLSGYANRYEKAPQSGFYVNPQYTLDFVFEVLADERNNIRIADSSLPGAVSDATGLFTGYLLLDAWIGNTDRHDQNWGVIERNTPKGVRRTMAPTFDHASCLGREVPEEKKRERLATNDRGFTVEAYVQRCPFRFVRKEGTQETLHPRTVFRHAVTAKPSAAVSWKRKLETLSMGDVKTLFERIPPERISEADVQFALRILHLNRHELLDP